jgi:hypothetical protein
MKTAEQWRGGSFLKQGNNLYNAENQAVIMGEL